MRFWLIVIWRAIPNRWKIVAAPLVLVIATFFGWFLFAGLLLEPVDLVQAVHAERLETLRPEAESGGAGAQYQVGIIYRDGLAGTTSPAIAAKWLGRAAAQGHSDAQVAAGRLYAAGSGVRQNYGRAAQYYRTAAVRGANAEAQYALGVLYFDGRGVDNDFRTAADWFRKAGLQGHGGAQSVLGAMYQKGWGIDIDVGEAFVWFSLANRQRKKAMGYRGDIDPEKELQKITARISRLQRQKAERRLRAMGQKKPKR
ncbi:MAG: sel1 repeat family protein [Rhodospirillaceae bacterium]|nr:sel1 repeat family protein [Rhodospirillaceae bacterium]